MNKRATVLVILLVLITISCRKTPEPASTLPAVELVDLNGKKLNLSQYAGKPVLVNFWATWCGPCRDEIPMLNDLYGKYSDHGLVIVGISMDDDGASAVKEFYKEVPIHYPSYLTTKDSEAKFGAIWALPTTYFYDRAGKQIDQPLVGRQTRDYFEKKIQQMLKQ